MTPEDALVAHYVATSMVMRLGTQSPAGFATVTPIWFVPFRGALVASTAASTVAARNVAADSRVSVLLDGEREGRSAVVLRLTGHGTVHPGLPPAAVVARLARRYYLRPAAARAELAHLRLWPARRQYYAQAEPVWIDIRARTAEILHVPG